MAAPLFFSTTWATNDIQKIQPVRKQKCKVPLVPPLLWCFRALWVCSFPSIPELRALRFSWSAAWSLSHRSQKSPFFSIQNSTASLVLRCLKHLCAALSLCSHCSARLCVLHSSNVCFYPSPHSSLFPLNSLQHSIPPSDPRNLTKFDLDSASCSQEHSVPSYSCDLNYFYEQILKVLSPIYIFFFPWCQTTAVGEGKAGRWELNIKSGRVRRARKSLRGMRLRWHNFVRDLSLSLYFYKIKSGQPKFLIRFVQKVTTLIPHPNSDGKFQVFCQISHLSYFWKCQNASSKSILVKF